MVWTEKPAAEKPTAETSDRKYTELICRLPNNAPRALCRQGSKSRTDRVGDTQIRNPIAHHTDRVEERGNVCLPPVRPARSGSNRSVAHTKTTGLASRPDPARVQGLGFVDTTLQSCWVRWLLGDLLDDGFGGGGFGDFGGF